jgi:hypothetical protein
VRLKCCFLSSLDLKVNSLLESQVVAWWLRDNLKIKLTIFISNCLDQVDALCQVVVIKLTTFLDQVDAF